MSAGKSSRSSSSPIRLVSSERLSHRSAARTSAAKTENSVPECVSSRHLRRSNHSRFPYQSSRSGVDPGCAGIAVLMTARSFLVHRKITIGSRARSPSRS